VTGYLVRLYDLVRLSMARFVGVLTTGMCREGTFGCSSALIGCSSCSSGTTASAAFCSFICGHGAFARVDAGQALRVLKLGVGPQGARKLSSEVSPEKI
jgi:hypothetical protein